MATRIIDLFGRNFFFLTCLYMFTGRFVYYIIEIERYIICAKRLVVSGLSRKPFGIACRYYVHIIVVPTRTIESCSRIYAITEECRILQARTTCLRVPKSYVLCLCNNCVGNMISKSLAILYYTLHAKRKVFRPLTPVIG